MRILILLLSLLGLGGPALAADINGQLKRADLENLSADPSLKSTGRVYFNTSGAKAKYWSGAAWLTVVDTTNTLLNGAVQNPMVSLGDLIYGASAGTPTALSGNTTTTKKFLTQTGTGTLSAVPAWGTIAGADVPALDASKITTGQVAIAQGGTGQATKTAAFNALTPATTKGDLTVFDGTNAVRFGVGADGQVLSAASGQTSGLQWTSSLTNPMTSSGDLIVGGTSGAANRLSTALLGTVQASTSSATVTATIASPAVVTLTSHGFSTGQTVYLTTTGALPTGLASSTTYYVIKIDANTFKLATTLGNALSGTAINTSGTQSGTHTVFSGGLVVSSLPGTFSGTAPASGYMGEKVEALQATFALAGSTSTFFDMGNVSLTPGTWAISYLLVGHLNGATCTLMSGGIGTAPSTSATGLTYGVTQADAMPPTSAGINTFVSIPSYIVTVSSTTIYYGKAYFIYSAGQPQYAGRLTAVRIN